MSGSLFFSYLCRCSEQRTDCFLWCSIVPSEDAHGSEYVAPGDKRRQWLSGYAHYSFSAVYLSSLSGRPNSFTGSAGQAVVSMNNAYLITDSRYWIQASKELDPHHWIMIPAGSPNSPRDWIEWLVVCVSKLYHHSASVALITSCYAVGPRPRLQNRHRRSHDFSLESFPTPVEDTAERIQAFVPSPEPHRPDMEGSCWETQGYHLHAAYRVYRYVFL